jgi:hypothetical protein
MIPSDFTQNFATQPEARAVFARLRELGPAKSEWQHPAGLFNFLSLSPEKQLARCRAGVERVVNKNPDNVQAQPRYLQLFEDGNTEQALSVTRKIALLKPNPTLAREARLFCFPRSSTRRQSSFAQTYWGRRVSDFNFL